MSNIGISIAGSVAQGSLQVQQVSRAHHRHTTDAAAEARQVRDRLDAHVAALDEGDEANLISQLRIDDQMPERDQHEEPSQNRDQHKQEVTEASQEEAVAQADAAQSSSNENKAYLPLDVTA